MALCDTRATNSCIKNSIALKYSLPICREVTCHGVNGINKVNTYLASIILSTNDIVHEIELTSCDDSVSIDMIIGMDIITKGEFIINTCNGITTYSFQLPAPTFLSLDQIMLHPNVKIYLNEEDKQCPCSNLLPFNLCCKKRD